ncbi:ATP-binding cassette domain-containing protein [Gordonia amarae]|uniref:ATP-binding cassette domain-containing protein n=2 Tax=Gordonia amarae TaxID=36821 RepID=A0A857KWR3_9ACTN|nr:ABC transporter ATP-binding protein [Gordonia amarae]MCS3878548.1 ATP-binding cassette subfamily B protein [Gordonia amarae]QHN17156.1 ATP-binding cassette domain-containing protein [Gordonia amarae]QHN21682.1 ATP-binding cassette domain-containing protein [Gordonia amarae]QHN30534.1 ATP-binding cassette domain-containing protein [Gordonia amarae]QHN39310.1 ATP-binding cassette domain-containing protein [Gordonia amarae]
MAHHDPSTTEAPSLRTLWKYLRFATAGEGSRYLGAGTLLLVAATAETLSVFVLADIINGTLAATTFADVAVLAAVWLGITVASTAADYTGQLTALGVSERVVLRLRDNLFAHTQRLSVAAHRRYGVGDLVTRHSDDLDAVEHLLGSGLLQLAVATMNVVGLAVVAFVMNWQVAVVALAAIPALWWASAWFARRQTSATRHERLANSDIAVAVTTALTGHETAVAYNQQAREHRDLHLRGKAWMAARLAQSRVELGFGSVLGVGEVLVTLAIAITGAWQVRAGNLSVGELLALTGYLALLYPKMQEIADTRLSMAAATVSAERVLAVLAELPGDTDRADAQPLRTGGTVEIRDVTVHRDHGPVLDGVSLTLEPGRIVALTGPSGAGKSTLAALLTRFVRPDSGTITVAGTDIGGVTAQSLREHLTLLPQQVTLKAGTIADNIAYGRPRATTADVIDAAIAADADRFIRALPDGYGTRLTEDGLTLSGGQRRRLAIARAILRDSPVLILDEPTTGLDDASAQRILEPLRRLAAGRTTLLITHDDAVAAIADDVVHLQNGRLSPVARAGHSDPVCGDPVCAGSGTTWR